jgi:hypothetical protein
VSDIDTLIKRLSDRQRREFALWCAERVRHLMTDPRSTDALDVAARHLRGEATDEELAAARDLAAGVRAAAWDAALATERAAQRAELERMLGGGEAVSEPLPTDRVVSSVSLIWYAGLLESAARALETSEPEDPDSEESPHQQLVRECREASESARFRARRTTNNPTT